MMTSNKLDSTGGSKRIVMPQNMFYDSKIVEQNNKQTKRKKHLLHQIVRSQGLVPSSNIFFSNLSFSLDRPKNQ